jgi:hypothetical protein
MEALQMLKFSLKQQQQLNFMEGWVTSEGDMWKTVDDEPDLLATLPGDANAAKPNIDRILAVVCQDDKDV